jgi:hypothetical protein
MSKSLNTSVSAKTRNVLWARSAGRCHYCNKDLVGDLLSGTPELIKGLVAHIVAEKPTGPRGDPVRSPQLIDNVGNLMLMCHPHHRLIDDEKAEEYPEERLLAIKQAHEHRVSVQTAITSDKATHILRYGARIGSNEALLSLPEMHEAVFPTRYPTTLTSIDLELVGCQFQDHEPEYWAFQQENLHRQIAQKLKGRMETSEVRHLSVFALAPQPLLVELGRQLGDIVPADVFQRHREPPTWRWPHDATAIDFLVSRPSTRYLTVALKIALSATVTDERIFSVLGQQTSIWSIAAESPHNDILKSLGDLRRFRQLMRRIFNDIKAIHGEDTVINIFPAMPVSTAVEVGRVWMPKADLPMVVFDQNKARGQFIKTLEIRAHEAV